jgi:hypothetical protein
MNMNECTDECLRNETSVSAEVYYEQCNDGTGSWLLCNPGPRVGQTLGLPGYAALAAWDSDVLFSGRAWGQWNKRFCYPLRPIF